MRAHTCPVCGGVGKIKRFKETCTAPWEEVCRACGGSCIVWEPPNSVDYPMNPIIPEIPRFPDPQFPVYPNPPTFIPNENIGLTLPKDFKFPKDIEESTTEHMIKYLEGWLKDLKKSRKKLKTEKK